MNDLERWEALVDDEACGDSLTGEARAFIDACDIAEAQSERAVYDALSAAAKPGPVADADLRAAEQTMARWSADKTAAPRRGRLIALGSAAVAIAAALALWIATPQPTTLEADPVGAQVTSGSLMLDNAALGAGATLPVGRWVVAQNGACIRSDATTSCVTQGTRVRARDEGLEISEGELDFEGNGTLLTPDGALTTQSGAFNVSVASDGSVVLTVESGHVTLTAPGAEDREFAAGASRPLGVVAMAAPPRVHEPIPAVEPSAHEPVEAVHTPAKTPRARKPRERVVPTAAQLLSEARGHVAAGEDRKALALYRDLRRSHPKSSAARAANVSIGEVHLRLGDGKSALKAFDAYLNTGSRALTEEALWGRIRALHRLGRAQQRDAAIARLVAKFPDSVYRKRAAAL